MIFRRGDVWLAELPSVGRKPVVVVSWNAINRALDAVIVARVTSVERERRLPTFVSLDPGDVPGLPRRSYVICHDLFTLSKELLVERLGGVPLQRLLEIETSLKSALDLQA